MILTTPHLVPTLRMSGTVPLLPLCAFMLWTGKTTFIIFEVHIVVSCVTTACSLVGANQSVRGTHLLPFSRCIGTIHEGGSWSWFRCCTVCMCKMPPHLTLHILSPAQPVWRRVSHTAYQTTQCHNTKDYNKSISISSSAAVVTDLFLGYLNVQIKLRRLNSAKLNGNGKSELTSVRIPSNWPFCEYKFRTSEFCFTIRPRRVLKAYHCFDSLEIIPTG